MATVGYVVDGGLALVVDGLEALGTTKWVAWGTGATGATAADTAMETAAAPTATAASEGVLSQETTDHTGDTVQILETITAGGSLTIKEVGVFNQETLSGAVCFIHATFDGIAVDTGDSIEFTIKAKFTQA